LVYPLRLFWFYNFNRQLFTSSSDSLCGSSAQVALVILTWFYTTATEADTDPAYPPQSYLVKSAKRLASTKCAANQMTANQMAGYALAVPVFLEIVRIKKTNVRLLVESHTNSVRRVQVYFVVQELHGQPPMEI